MDDAFEKVSQLVIDRSELAPSPPEGYAVINLSLALLALAIAIREGNWR